MRGGSDYLRDNALSSQILALDRAAGGRSVWVVYDDRWLSNLFRAIGVRAVGGVHYYPQRELWSRLDPKGESEPAWNRYAHVVFSAGPVRDSARISAPFFDTVRVELCPESAAFRSLGASHVLAVGEQAQPTLTGMLFFGRDPQLFYPSLTVTFLHFPGTSTARNRAEDPLYLDNREFHGALPAIIDATRATIYDRIEKQARVEGFVRHDVPEYPEVAYREAIVNAVGHRDYALEGGSVQVRLFADRVEIQSPGGLGGHLTVDNIAYEQYTRNPHIMTLLEDYGYVERRGLGVDQMIRAMAHAGLEPPAFENRGSSCWVTLKGRPP